MEKIQKKTKFNLLVKNPRFKFKQFVITMKEYSNGFSDRFEVFTYNKDNNQYIISPGVNTYLIYLIRMTDSKLFKYLKGHNECISVLNYFKNDKNKNEEEYILSVDIKGILIIWDINKDFNIKHKINTKEYVIFSSIIVFNINNIDNYIITSNSYIQENDNSSYSKIYSLSKGKFIKNLKNTNYNKTYYIFSWHNKKRNIIYEVECCLGKISIIDIVKNEIYHEFFKCGIEEAFTSGFIYNKNNNDYLCTSSMHGEIKFWNLENGRLEKKIYSGNYNLQAMIQWSDKYVIFSDNNNNKSFKILDIDLFKIISNIGGKHKKPIICIKKINHNIYGNILITSGTDKSIIIWDLK